MRNAFISALYDLAAEDERILALVADNGAIVYDKYRAAFPQRFINFGIAEANMVAVAAGLAACGKIPFAYTIAGFLTMRAFEQVRNDVCLQKTNVKLVGIGVGFVYSDLGPTHHTVEDIALMRTLPGMTIFSPADPEEARQATYAAAHINGPVYLRLATSRTPSIYDGNCRFEPGKGVTLREGNDLTIISTGNIVHEVLKSTAQLERDGLSIRVINMPTLKPADTDIILHAAHETDAVLTVEEHTIFGGLGTIVAELLMENGISTRFKRLGLNGRFPQGYGTYQEMKEINGLSQNHICAAARHLIEVREDHGEIIECSNTLA
ncbi:MAG: transketolase family protein [Sedimentisphaerales bacterium]|nr:transketolase family protein [Sedimentisphaerales bacterium]